MVEVNNEQVKSPRERLNERLKGKYPDKTFEDDDAVFGQINDDFDDLDKQIGESRAREEQLSNMFTADPRSAHFLNTWRNGGDPAVELIRQFGTDIKEAIDDPEKQEEIAAANKEFVERVAKEKELEEQYQKNIAQSLANLEEFQNANGLTDEQVDDAMQFLVNIMKDGIMGIFKPESIDMAMKAINHDSDVQTAEEEGMVRGKNAKVDLKLRKDKSGDGVPQLNGKNGAAAVTNGRKSIFDVARGAR